MDAYAGIDVAFAKRKRLPIVVCTASDGCLKPLPLRRATVKPPLGRGNALILDAQAVADFADETARYLKWIESEFRLNIRRIAIDAPSEPKQVGAARRLCEIGLDRRRIS